MSDLPNSTVKRPIDTIVESAENVAKKLKIEQLTQVDNGIHEADVGITLYLSPDLPGFKGQIKQRYTDFLVNEIDQEGNVVHLTDKGFKMPKKPQRSREEANAEKEVEAARREEFQVNPELRGELVEIFGEGDVSKIEAVYRMANRMETEKSFEDKTVRTKIHQLLRQAFNNELESVTTDTNTFKIARSSQHSRTNKQEKINQTKDSNGVENWGYGPSKDFIHFALHKENKDTMEAVNVITKLLRVPSRVIRYAGTKDRRAVTCQRLSISKIGLDRLNALNRTLKGMIIGNYSFSDASLNLGDLKGNEFVVVIRDVSVDNNKTSLEDIVSNGCKSLSENGFVNYFGMQRFGTFSISTHTIGRELLLSNWEEAAELILSDQENVLPKSKEARKIWAETKDASLALKQMPRQCLAENALLYSLSNQRKEDDGTYSANAYYTAIMKIPRNLRTMYVHAYQSYVWNSIASKRVELHGLKLVVGDLVIADTEKPVSNSGIDDEDFDEDVREAQFVRAKAVTQDDIDSGKYSMEDVVLPSPGFDVLYPSNEELKQLYVDILKADNMDPFDMRRKVRDFSLAGSYRNVVQKPKSLEYKIIHYDDPSQQIANTDLDILNNTKAKESGQKYMKAKLDRYMPDKGGDKTAVVLKFQLGTSAYATMALRELMKLETSRRGDMCDVKEKI
ncbi:pus7p [Saccharomyces arboricola H-6]|uniref:Pus7p n=1 Tax=Saccharomyces arboricola (strain H-6 / AS 2.3317 / CBS 10644) TaxID=1160507 RepID=J8PW45_SACAR|nr:pus7p [Saccharomyces arboricola H-6]